MNSTENESKNILDEAMKDVIQELLINDKDDVSHLVFIHKVYWDNGLKVEFSTVDEDKEALIPLVHDAILAQMSNIKMPEVSLWGKLKDKAVRFLMKFSAFC
ncbi:membrane-associated initiation of head vertex [Yersinia phage JC221]|nr:membrane-associated initiation of head vertex [Yersinia phage JC221]